MSQPSEPLPESEVPYYVAEMLDDFRRIHRAAGDKAMVTAIAWRWCQPTVASLSVTMDLMRKAGMLPAKKIADCRDAGAMGAEIAGDTPSSPSLRNEQSAKRAASETNIHGGENISGQTEEVAPKEGNQ